MAGIIFNPILGSEEKILSRSSSPGSVYFTTDTRKIYLDIDQERTKIPMGGNVGLFYGNMKLSSPAVEGQTEFEFKIVEIIGNETGEHMLKPNANDLILNTDGCFYKVLSSYGEDVNTVLITEKLAIAGTGGGGGSGDGGSSSLAGMSMSRLRFDKGQTVLYQAECPVSFAVKITDDLGDPQTGNVGTYDLYINSVKKQSGTVIGSTASDVTDLNSVNSREINTIDVGPYLMLGENINVKISVNGINGGVITRAGTVSTTNMVLTWDYDETSVNVWDQVTSSMNLEWNVSGNLEKTTHIIINDDIDNSITVVGTKPNQSVKLDFIERNLWHGAHKIEMYATAEISGGIARTPSIYKNIMIAKSGDESTIISCNLFNTTLMQYDTIQIPIIIYDPTTVIGTSQVRLIENGEERDVWDDVQNSTVRYWSYTPTTSGTVVLTIQCNNIEKSLTLSVEPVNIDINEKENYAFRFKASDFTSNTNVQKWNSNGIGATFTSTAGEAEKFDWHNGGLKTEIDAKGNARQYLCIKAGSQMTINYALWRDLKANPFKGKCLKVIFKATKCKDYDGQVLKCHDGYTGLTMRAQNAVFSFSGKSLNIPYCENEYIEFELDISPNVGKTRYIRPWLDGVPAGVQIYATNDYLYTDDETFVTIGSDDCDVYLYMIKLYETHLTDDEHLDNFIADAPNATEMIDRFNRNDILDESGEISYTKLAEKNPDCYVHLYEMDRMTTTKKDPVPGCVYTQYHGSKNAVLSAEDVTVKVQGTSSAAYGLAAFNLDSNFEYNADTSKGGFTDLVTNQHIDKWSMSPTAIPVDYFCTKVNVASAEGTNNALNQEWYNRFQPYQTIVRGKRKGEYNTARDCMEFIPGVLFIKDNNPETKDDENINGNGGKGDNVFKDTPGYCDTVGENGLLTSSYYKLYSVACMGNSKDNIEVFHDTENPYECCVENGDNQLPGQWMTDIQGGYSVNDTFYPVSINSINKNDKTLCPDGIERDNRTLWETAMDEIYGFRYPDGIKEVKKRDSAYAESMIQGWYDFVYWMAHSNPQPAYERVFFNDYYALVVYKDEAEFADDNRQRYIINTSGEYETIDTYDAEAEYYIFVTAEEAFTARAFDIYRWADAAHTDYVLVTSDETFNSDHTDLTVQNELNAYFKKTEHVFGATNKKLPEDVTFEDYTFKGYKVPQLKTIDNEVLDFSQYQKNYTPVLQGVKISTYANTYTHDTYAYRMAKMLSECEEHLCMDSIVFHYLFIERHSMVDNIAKNTFWSTEDGKVWNLTKNYDNDTADGNDNQGKLSLTYGFEPGDVDDKGVSIFNAGNSVWLAFINGLYDACQAMYVHLENKNAWDPKLYLQAHTKWQSAIPERCWIQDYYRKYLRPYEVYNSQMFLDMHDGGQKKHQRTQYETYQNYYIASRYFGKACQTNMFTLRAEGADITNIKVPVQLYANCYIRGAYGSGTTNPNLSIRCKRNEDILIESPISNATDATIYLWPSNLYQKLGDETTGLNDYGLTQFEAQNAKKLRTIALGTQQGSMNTTLKKITFENNENLENVYVAKYAAAETLDLTDSPGLLVVDARDSGFSSVTLPENAPTTDVQLNAPVTISLTNLSNLQKLAFQKYDKLQDVQIKDIDRSPSDKVNSKIIIDNAINLLRYKLENVIWSITDINELNVDNGTINILERLKSLTPSSASGAGQISQQEALTGTLTITVDSNKLSDTQALKIYDTYAKAKETYIRVIYANEQAFNTDNRIKYTKINGSYEVATNYNSANVYYVVDLLAEYPNLDINFTNNQLYSVNIYDGNENVKWSRKTIAGTVVDEEFLKYGPNGSFSSSSIQKTSTAEYEYLFQEQWIVKDDEGNELTVLNAAEPLYNVPIQGNIHMYPQFITQKRSYTVSVKMKNPLTNTETILKEGTYEYGTKLNEVLPANIIPYVDSSSLGLLEVYDFKGYSLLENSTTPVSNNYTVTGAANLWAIFVLEFNARSVVHPEWFSYTPAIYVKDINNVTYGGDPNFGQIEGLSIAPKNNCILQGKITIPAEVEYEGKMLPIIKIGGFGVSSGTGTESAQQKVTHIFIEDGKANKIYEIEDYAFNQMDSLMYFDFDYANLRWIGRQGFRRCPLRNTTIGKDIFYVGYWGFNAAFKSDSPITLRIPARLTTIEKYGFSFLDLKNSSLIIGSENELSHLNLGLSDYTNEENYYWKFPQNEGTAYKNIDFFSALYDNDTDIIVESTNLQVSNAFGKNFGTLSVV